MANHQWLYVCPLLCCVFRLLYAVYSVNTVKMQRGKIVGGLVLYPQNMEEIKKYTKIEQNPYCILHFYFVLKLCREALLYFFPPLVSYHDDIFHYSVIHSLRDIYVFVCVGLHTGLIYLQIFFCYFFLLVDCEGEWSIWKIPTSLPVIS